jgi:acetylornithine deacetylase/succinyl-diaminopimelate desuccinylase-like protein
MTLAMWPAAVAPAVLAGKEALQQVRAYRHQNAARILADFAELLAIPNAAADTVNIRRNAEFIRGELQQRGAHAELWTLPGAPPVVYGHLEAPGAERTLGIYVHYDGQPVDPTQWHHPAWSPTLYSAPIEAGGRRLELPAPGDEIGSEWRLYARSAGDDKAPLAALFAALDALRASQIPLTSNLLFLFEGEEEAGSGHLGEYMRARRGELEVDVWLIFDGPVHQSRRPQLVFGVRGYTGLDITVYGATRYLHSGHYGNWAPNPAQRLAALLASMKDDEGNVLIDGFYESTAPVSATERLAMASLPDYDAELRRELGLAATEADNALLAERLLLPSLNIRGLVSAAVGDAARNIIPTQATASIDVRLAKGNDPGEMLDRVEEHISGLGYHIVRDEPDLETRLRHERLAKVVRRSGYPAARTAMDLAVVQEVIEAAELAAGESLVLLPTLGGSLPLYLFNEILEAPVVITPIANHDNNQHAPNENLRLANLWYGVDLMAALMSRSVGPTWSDELRALATWMSGSFSSRRLAEADPGHYFDISLFMTPIWTGRDDGPWLYVEQAAAASLERPYRQRIYRLSEVADGSLRCDVFTLAGDPLRFSGAWRDPDLLLTLDPSDLILREGCSVFLRRVGPGTFAGATEGRQCSSDLQGAIYATSEIIITPSQLISWDRGFNAEDVQVWGVERGAYVFQKSTGD